MRITRLRLRDVRRHSDLVIEPHPGLTIIRGPNESGKSTIQQALELALFRKADSTAQATLEIQRWGSDQAPVIEMDFEVEGTSGHLVKSFGGSRGSAELTLGEEVIRDPTAIQAHLERITGIPTERFFRATANVRHAELSALDSDDRQLQDRLQVVVSGADRGTARAKGMLDEAIRRHTSQGPKNPGTIRSTRERGEALRRRLETAEEALTRLGDDRAAWAAAHERRVVLEGQLAHGEAELERADLAVSLAERRDEAQTRYERLRRAAALQDLADAAVPPTSIPLAELRPAVAGIEQLELEISELEADLEAVDEEGDPADAPPAPTARGPWSYVALGAVLAVLALVGYVLLPGVAGLAAFAALALGALASMVVAVRMVRQASQAALSAQMARAASEGRRETARARLEDFRRRRRDLEARLATIGVSSAPEASALLERAQTHADEMLRVQSELRGLLGDGEPPPDLRADRDRAANDAEQARHALSDMGDVGVDPGGARRRAQATVMSVRTARDEARSEEDRTLGRVEANDVDAERVADLAEQLAATSRQLAELERRARIYRATLEAIETAEQATLRIAARYLEERMGPDVAMITGGRYERVEVDERTLAFTVLSPERGGSVSVSGLSHGTIDQLYLSARLGLVGLVTMGRTPPIVLDDPFVSFDGQRTARSIALLREKARERGFQILFLTCSDGYDDLADKVIVLDPPAAMAPAMAPLLGGAEAGSPLLAGAEAGSPLLAGAEPDTPHEPEESGAPPLAGAEAGG